MKEKIIKIQNGAKSLLWGYTRHSETETLFAVGHKSYPRQTKFFMVSDDFVLSLFGDDYKIALVKSCENEVEVLKVIYDLLKQWFPAKGGADVK